MNDRWDNEQANQMLRETMAEIDEFCDKLSPARAEALLDEFEQEVGRAFVRQDLTAVKAACEDYRRRFLALSEDE